MRSHLEIIGLVVMMLIVFLVVAVDGSSHPAFTILGSLRS